MVVFHPLAFGAMGLKLGPISTMRAERSTDAGGLHLPFEAGAVIETGITSLHPSQAIEALVTKRADGSLVVAEIRLSVGERAQKLAELERQSQAAEENYRIELMRRQVH